MRTLFALDDQWKTYSIEEKARWVATKFTHDEILEKRTADLIRPTEDVCIYYWGFFTPVQIFLGHLISYLVKWKVSFMQFALASPLRLLIGIETLKRTIHICLVWKINCHIWDFPLVMMKQWSASSRLCKAKYWLQYVSIFQVPSHNG